MGGSSVGAGKSKAGGDMPKEMRQIITQSFKELTDLRQNLIGQYMGILQGTGPMKYGVTGIEEYKKKSGKTRTREVYGWTESDEAGAQVPMIAQAQEAQRRATSQAMTGTQESLAQRGLAGTPFGEQMMAGQRQQGAQAVAGSKSNITQQMLGMIPNYTQGASQAIMGSLAGTRETQAQAKSWM